MNEIESMAPAVLSKWLWDHRKGLREMGAITCNCKGNRRPMARLWMVSEKCLGLWTVGERSSDKSGIQASSGDHARLINPSPGDVYVNTFRCPSCGRNWLVQITFGATTITFERIPVKRGGRGVTV